MLARLDVNCIKSFSDDVKIYVIVNSIKDSSGLLHSGLGALCVWYKMWRLNISALKRVIHQLADNSLTNLSTT